MTNFDVNTQDLAWTASPGAEAYIVRRGTAPGNEVNYTTWPTTSFRADHLDPGTQYCWNVTAYNAAGEISAPSNEVCLTTSGTPGGPQPPATVTATAISDTRIDVAWSAAAGASKYYVQRATAAAGPYTHVGSVLEPSTSFLDVNLTPATTYYYQIVTVALDQSESAPSSPPASATTFGSIAPPTNVSATAISDTRINVSWTAAAGASKYFVYQSTNYNGPYSFAGTTTSPSTSFLAANLNASTEYCFRVSSVDAGQTESAQSTPPACATTFAAGGGNFAGWWRFDERTGTVANDSSGNNRNGSLVGGAAFQTTDKAQIDDNQSVLNVSAASTATVTVPNAVDFNLEGSFTVAFWAKPSAGTVLFIGMRSPSCGALGWEIGQGALGLYFAGQSGTVNSGTTLSTTAWSHVAVTNNNSTNALTFYVNGAPAGSGVFVAGNSNPNELHIGHVAGCPGAATLMDDVQIYSRELTAGDIAVLGTLPPAPTNLVITNTTSTSMDLAWDPVPGATAYIISKGTAPGNETFYTHTPNTTTFNADHLTPNTAYSWTVRAVVNGLFSNPSNSASGTTNGPPAAPTNVQLTLVSNDRIQATWDAVPNAVKYYVFRSANGGPFVAVDSVLAPSTTHLSVNLAASTTYTYQIQAEDSVQTVGPMSAPVSLATP